MFKFSHTKICMPCHQLLCWKQELIRRVIYMYTSTNKSELNKRSYSVSKYTHRNKSLRYSKYSCHKNTNNFTNVRRYHASDKLLCVIVYSSSLCNSLLGYDSFLRWLKPWDFFWLQEDKHAKEIKFLLIKMK